MGGGAGLGSRPQRNSLCHRYLGLVVDAGGAREGHQRRGEDVPRSEVVALRDAIEGGTLYVRATGTAYPVAIVEKGHSETIVFDRWNQQVVVRAPKNALSLGTSA